MIVGDKFLFKVECDVLEKIMSGIWVGEIILEFWMEKVLIFGFYDFKIVSILYLLFFREGKMVVRFELDKEIESRDRGDWLSGRILVLVDV